MTAEVAIQTMVDRIVQRFHPLRVILFSSHSRGSAVPESDVDLLVVLREVVDKRRTTVEIRRALGDLPVSKDIVVTTPDEIARRGDLIGSVLRPALRDGKVVYEQQRVARHIQFSFRHDLDALRNLLPDDWAVKQQQPDLAELTEWAVEARYPGDWPDSTAEMHGAQRHRRALCMNA